MRVIAILGQHDERLDLFCKADRMLEQTLFEQGNEFELISVHDLSVSNAHFKASFESARSRLSKICGTEVFDLPTPVLLSSQYVPTP